MPARPVISFGLRNKHWFGPSLVFRRGLRVKFHVATPPESADFQPLEDGWTLLKEPRFIVLAVMATVVGILVAMLTLMAWNAIAADAIALATLSVSSPMFFFVGLLVVVVVHEFVHAIGYPRFGLNDARSLPFCHRRRRATPCIWER